MVWRRERRRVEKGGSKQNLEEKGSEKDGKGNRKGKGVERKRKFFSGG